MFKKILIYRIGNLGDIICSIPAMVAIRQNFPDAWVGLITNKEKSNNPDAEEILKGNDFLSEIITYESEKISQPSYLWDLSKNIRKLKIDLLVYLALSKTTRRRLIRDWLFFSWSGCKKLLGFKLPKPLLINTQKGINSPVFPQEVNRLMSLVSLLGIDPAIVEFRLPIKQMDKKNVGMILDRFKINNLNPLIAICFGGKFSVTHWPLNHYLEVIAILKEKYHAKIIILGGPFEEKHVDAVSKIAGDSVLNLIDKTTYMESAEILSRCNLLIANDCGAVHLAAAVGTPVVGIYSSRNFPGSWHPWGKNHTVLRNDTLPCRFCFRTECETMKCINSITVEQVINACSTYLTA